MTCFSLWHLEWTVEAQVNLTPIFQCALQIDGDWRYDSRHSQLVWSIDLIDASNRSGAAEFVVPATDPGTFFPVEVSFSAQKTLCDIQVRHAMSTGRAVD